MNFASLADECLKSLEPRLAAAGLARGQVSSEEMSLGRRVRTFEYVHIVSRVVLDFMVIEETGTISASVKNPLVTGTMSSSKPGCFRIAAYLEEKGRKAEADALFPLSGERLCEYIDHVVGMAESELADLIQGKRWEFIVDPELSRYF
jgi:hypothetical protein